MGVAVDFFPPEQRNPTVVVEGTHGGEHVPGIPDEKYASRPCECLRHPGGHLVWWLLLGKKANRIRFALHSRFALVEGN
jgi:hypothetical protein